MDKFAHENNQLRDQLVQMTQPGANPSLRGSNAEPAVLIFIATLLVLACFVSGEKLVLFGSAVPLLLAAVLLKGSASSAQHPLGDTLLCFLMQLRTLFRRTSRSSGAALHKLLYQRHRLVGRQVLRRLGCTPALGLLPHIKTEPMVS